MSGTAAVDLAAYRDAIGRFATGVAVVTTLGPAGPAGATVSAVCSLSLDPLLALVCFDHGSRTLAAVRVSRRLAINVLAREQRALARSFAGKAPEAEKFDGVGWTEVDGAPVLDGTIAWLAGEVAELLPGGDHEIAIVRVSRVEARDGEPLVYYRARFHDLGAAG